MGEKYSKIKKKFHKKNKNRNKGYNEFAVIKCPFCYKIFDVSKTVIFNQHVRNCAISVSSKIDKGKSCDIYTPSSDSTLNKLIFKNILEYQKNEPNNFIDKRIEDKINELKMDITEKKLLDEGSIRICLDRETLLKDILLKTEDIDLYKEWKINFTGELSIDAGGILREFFTIIFEILEGEQLKLFIPSESSEFSYILNPFLKQNEENFKLCKLIGLLMAKAIIQNITINICFNKLIYKMILCEKIEFQDLIFIDSQLYNSFKNLKESIESNTISNGNGNEINNSNILNELGLDYSIEMKDCYNCLHSFELIENGRNKIVDNLDDFIQTKINFLIGIYEPFVKQIRDTFYKYIPIDKVKCLNSSELELLLNGRPFIDIEEWKSYTEYKEPYNENHIVIKWFWEILSELSQNELSNLLLFATGSSRVPLGGFADLEGNNGYLSRFTIEYIIYNNNVKNFIKAHTCFNRIDLPCFTNKNDLKNAIKFVSENQIWGFGME